ncbi:MAG: hypothetical protein K5867_04095 [Bacteroidales bacterium]|nr:hypothetical protein [Bacteroidales bacterium]
MSEVYNTIVRLMRRRRANGRWPESVTIDELMEATGMSQDELRPELLSLYREGRIDCGRTFNSAWIATKTSEQ